jgi:hypothetical protein
MLCRELTLRNLRKLLKPGGYLLIAEGNYNGSGGDGGLNFIFGTLPGWWLGADQGRTLSPYLSTGEWDHVLKTTGFSGIDVAPPKELADSFGVSVFVSQAVDDQVSFLRNPIGMPFLGSPIQKLVVIGGLTPRSSHLVEGLERILSTSIEKIHHFGTLEDVDYSIIDQQTTVVSLTELDKPIFLNMTARTFSAFKQMFETGKTLLWVTSGRLEDQPYSNLTLGFGRTALVETPDLRLQQLDLAEPEAVDPLFIAQTLLRFASAAPETVVWTVEPEIIVDAAGNEFVPRLKPISTFNDRYNSSMREIKQLVSTKESSVTLEMTDNGCIVKELAAPHRLSNPPGHLYDLRTVYTTSTAIKTTLGHQFLVLCQEVPTGATYLALVPSLVSTYKLPVTSVVLCDTAKSYDAAFLSLLAAHLVSIALFDNLCAGQTVVVHNSTEPIATAMKLQASTRGFNLVFTADSTNTAAVGLSLKLAPYLTQYELSQALPKETSLFVGLSTSDAQRWENEMSIMSYLPLYCRKESASTIYTRQGLSGSAATADVLRSALNNIAEDDPADLQRARPLTDSVDVGSLLERALPADPLTIIDWTTCTSLPVTVTRLDSQQLFGSDKTYWIVGLSAALGASLFDWMIERGARNLVFTSRRPQLDPAWIESHKRNGVRILKIPW